MAILQASAGTLLVAWFIFSVLCQFKNGTSEKLREWDSFSLLPSWTFFSPVPGTKDYRLVAQDLDDETNAWHVLEQTVPNSHIAFLFNPNKVRKKCLIDVANQAVEARNKFTSEPRLIWITHSYLSSLSVVQKRTERMAGFSRFRFSIFSNNGYFSKEELGLILLSEEHSRDPNGH